MLYTNLIDQKLPQKLRQLALNKTQPPTAARGSLHGLKKQQLQPMNTPDKYISTYLRFTFYNIVGSKLEEGAYMMSKSTDSML